MGKNAVYFALRKLRIILLLPFASAKLQIITSRKAKKPGSRDFLRKTKLGAHNDYSDKNAQMKFAGNSVDSTGGTGL